MNHGMNLDIGCCVWTAYVDRCCHICCIRCLIMAVNGMETFWFLFQNFFKI